MQKFNNEERPEVKMIEVTPKKPKQGWFQSFLANKMGLYTFSSDQLERYSMTIFGQGLETGLQMAFEIVSDKAGEPVQQDNEPAKPTIN